jgi:hypothetical protein
MKMTNVQDTNSKTTAIALESGKDAAQNTASQIATASDKDALGDPSLDDVSGGGWPYATIRSQQVTPTI